MTEPDLNQTVCALEDADWLAGSDLPDLARAAQAERARRAGRSRHLPAAALAEPSWDILLGVFAARAAGQGTTFAAVCQTAGVPPATALRSVCMLQSEGLLIQRRDPRDQGTVWLDLTDPGMDRMCAYFREVRASDSA